MVQLEESSRTRLKTISILLIFALLQWLLRAKMFYVSDDAQYINTMPMWTVDQIIGFFWSTTGRFFSEGFGAFLVLQPFWIWKLLDTILYTAAAWLFTFLIDDVRSPRFPVTLLMTCTVILCLPVSFLVSAGFIMTSTNYVYGPICMLGALAVLKYTDRAKAGRGVTMLLTAIGLFCSVYAGNQEQSGCVFGGLLTGLLVDEWITRRELRPMALAFLLADAASLCSILCSPGMLSRTTYSGGVFALEGYQQWRLSQRLGIGITTTAAQIYLRPLLIFMLLCVLLALAGVLISPGNRSLMFIMPVCAFEVYEIMNGFTANVLSYGGMPDTDHGLMSWIIITGLTVLIALAVWFTYSRRREALWTLWLLCIAALSHIMMGFSATLVGSGHRTYIFQLILIAAVCVRLLQLLLQALESRPRIRQALAGCMVMIGMLTFYQNMLDLICLNT